MSITIQGTNMNLDAIKVPGLEQRNSVNTQRTSGEPEVKSAAGGGDRVSMKRTSAEREGKSLASDIVTVSISQDVQRIFQRVKDLAINEQQPHREAEEQSKQEVTKLLNELNKQTNSRFNGIDLLRDSTAVYSVGSTDVSTIKITI